MRTARFMLGLVSFCAFSVVNAAELEIQVQNLMHGTYVGGLVVAAHASGTKIFQVGMPASLSLQKLAEGGNFADVSADLKAAGANVLDNPAAGPLAPGKLSNKFTLMTTGGNNFLSLAGMIVPTNDGFLAANAIAIPTAKGEYVYMLNAYDAGTEANNELRGAADAGMPGHLGMPVAPFLEADVGHNGTGVATTAEGFVHIHRGVIGDDNPMGGKSDIDMMSQRWLNPIARLVITVK